MPITCRDSYPSGWITRKNIILSLFNPWKFTDVPADELQEHDVIAFFCDGDTGHLIVVTDKARIYKFDWGEWDYERVRAFPIRLFSINQHQYI